MIDEDPAAKPSNRLLICAPTWLKETTQAAVRVSEKVAPQRTARNVKWTEFTPGKQFHQRPAKVLVDAHRAQGDTCQTANKMTVNKFLSSRHDTSKALIDASSLANPTKRLPILPAPSPKLSAPSPKLCTPEDTARPLKHMGPQGTESGDKWFHFVPGTTGHPRPAGVIADGHPGAQSHTSHEQNTALLGEIPPPSEHATETLFGAHFTTIHNKRLAIIAPPSPEIVTAAAVALVSKQAAPRGIAVGAKWSVFVPGAEAHLVADAFEHTHLAALPQTEDWAEFVPGAQSHPRPAQSRNECRTSENTDKTFG